MMSELVKEQLRKGNSIQFPTDNKDMIAVLNREDKNNKNFYIYDLRRQCFVRKISKFSLIDESFATDMTGKILAFCEGEILYIKLIRIPNSPALADVLRPRYHVAKMKLNPAVASENKQQFRDRLYY